MDDQENALSTDIPTKGTDKGLSTCLMTLLSFTLAFLLNACATNRADQEVKQASLLSPAVLALYKDGVAYFRNNDLKSARERYQAALQAAYFSKDEPGIGVSLLAIGATHETEKEHTKALEFYTAALPYLRKTQDLVSEGLALSGIGRVQIQQGNDASAIKAFEEAVARYEGKLLTKISENEKLETLKLRGGVLFAKAGAHARQKQILEAMQTYRAAANDFKSIHQKDIAGTALYGLGQLHLDRGNLQEAVAAFSEVVEVAEPEGLSRLAMLGHFGLARAFETLSEFQKALANYQVALRWHRTNKDHETTTFEPGMLLHMGYIHRWLSRYEEAIEHFRLAVTKYREKRDVRGEADALTQLGEVFTWLGDLKTADDYYKQALSAYQSAGNLHKQIEILAALAETTGRLGGIHAGETVSKYFTEAEKLDELIVRATGIDLSPLWKKWSAMMAGGYEEEDIRFARDYQAKQNLVHSPIAIADVHRLMRQSKELFNEWEKRVPSLGKEYLSAVGTLFQKWGVMLLSGQTKEALNVLLRAQRFHTSMPLERKVAIEWVKDWFFIGEAYRRLGSHELALVYFDMATLLALELKTPEVHWVFAGTARTLAEIGRTDSAVAAYKVGLEIFESIQELQDTEEVKTDVLAEASYVYRDFVALLLKLYNQSGEARYLQEAFQYNEAGRARAFLSLLGKSRSTRLSGQDGSLAAEEEKIRTEIAQVHYRLRSSKFEPADESRLLRQLESLRESSRDLQRRAAQKSPRYSQVVFPQPTNSAKVQSILNADTAFLEYSTASETSTLWVITKDQVRAYALPSPKAITTLEEYIKTLREPLMEVGEARRHITLGQQLYQLLLGPAEEQIRGKKHLIIAPDGPLYYLPFETLILPPAKDTDNEPRSLAESRYLIKEYTISYVPSASVLVTQWTDDRMKKQTTRLPLLAFGDPVYSGREPSGGEDTQSTLIANIVLRGLTLDRLEFSREEVLGIANVFGVSPTSDHINLRDRATVQRLRELDLSQYRILHFAAHGILSDEVTRSNQPALVLSQGGNDSTNLLQFSDILQMKLDADLVVLSACETGLGTLREGEGIVGLTRAFIYAGAASTVVSLWKVQDQSTSLLMERFYQNLKRGQSKAEALRQAKLATMRSTIDLKATGMRQDLASPFFWAPFILVGDWGPIQAN